MAVFILLSVKYLYGLSPIPLLPCSMLLKGILTVEVTWLIVTPNVLVGPRMSALDPTYWLVVNYTQRISWVLHYTQHISWV